VPLHNSQPAGIDATDPDHITITPLGSMFDRLFDTKAVVATCVLLVPLAAVGAVTPANYTRENRDAAILRINPNINLNAISEADKQIIAQQLGL
jgi:hypothetical protein